MAEERGTHGHDHNHDHDRTFQPDIEDSAPSDSELRAEALRQILIEKGVMTAEEIRKEIEKVDSVEPSLGGRIVARAWTDSAFKARLLESGTQAVKEFGIDMGDAELIAVENTAERHNLIVCTLCSCYPWMVLGLPPRWYKDPQYRSRIVREPRSVLKEMGLDLPADVEIRIWDSSAEVRYMVLPQQPEHSLGKTEQELVQLVTRNSMVGVESL